MLKNLKRKVAIAIAAVMLVSVFQVVSGQEGQVAFAKATTKKQRL